MNKQFKDLFWPAVKPIEFNPSFKYMQTKSVAEAARLMANEVFQDFLDVDGNFVQQFQTTGFDSRIFELYLYAYFSRSGYKVTRPYERPDFMLTHNGITVAVESTTVNPSQVFGADTQKIEDLTADEMKEKINNELPIRFGSPLFSKVNKKYWELEHVKGKPLVLAIEAFHGRQALFFSGSSLGQYLYGLRSFPDWSESGHLLVRDETISDHVWRTKRIPSNFFGQQNTEYISAILFSNSGTYPKFNRMGYEAGYQRGNTELMRRGTCYDPDPNAAKPAEFAYDVDDPPTPETWGQGIMVFHNPNARFPIPQGWFVNAAESTIENSRVKVMVPHFHPYTSMTLTIPLQRGTIDSRNIVDLPIESILKRDFESLTKVTNPLLRAFAVEKEWFADKRQAVLGVVIFYKADKDWAYAILGRDVEGIFRCIAGDDSIDDRSKARDQLIAKMLGIVQSGQTVFS